MKTILGLLFIFLVFNNALSVRVQRNNLESDILKKILQDYNPHVKPSDGNSTLVKVNLFVRDIQSLCTEKGQLTTQLSFRLKWTDRRLNYEDESIISYVTLTSDELIWTPDIFFTNDLDSKQQTMLKPNTLIRIKRNGDVLMSKRVTVVTSCSMNLVNFPFDLQKCPIKIASYGYTTDELRVEWENEQAIQTTANSAINLRNFELQKFTQKGSQSKTVTGTYSYLELAFYFKRSANHYFLTVYTPSTMVVIVSWLSFWINSKDQLLKSLICLFSLFTLAIGLTILNQSLPKVAYAKAIDVYSGTCMTFIFAAFIESIVVYLRCSTPSSDDGQQLDKTINENGIGNSEFAKKFLKCVLNSKSDKVDCISRIAFPIAFFLFAIIYFLVFC